MRTHRGAGLALASVALACFLTGNAAEQVSPRYTILPVDVISHTVISINDRQLVVGSSIRVDENGEGQDFGFALSNRFLDPIDFVENQADVLGHVFVTGQNDRGEIVGLLNFRDGSEIGFRHSLGKLEAIKAPPDASPPPSPHDINNKGDVVGWVQILSPNGAVVQQGFLLRNGVYTLIQVPDARRTCAFDINNGGTIVGTYSDAASSTHGFVLRNGRFTTIDIPNSHSTEIGSINSYGDIVGVYFSNSSVRHAFRSNVNEFINRN